MLLECSLNECSLNEVNRESFPLMNLHVNKVKKRNYLYLTIKDTSAASLMAIIYISLVSSGKRPPQLTYEYDRNPPNDRFIGAEARARRASRVRGSH